MRANRYQSSGNPSKGRSNAEKRRGAVDIKRKLDWLRYPWIYWAGSRPDIPFLSGIPFQRDASFRPLLVKIASRLEGLQPGIYAIRLGFRGLPPKVDTPIEEIRRLVNPHVAEVIEITDARIAATAQALKAADKYPKALGQVTGDAAAWHATATVMLTRAGAALAASKCVDGSELASLMIEEMCLWIGPDEKRPSRRVRTEDLRSWLEQAGLQGDLGTRVAAVELGRRKVRCRLPRHLNAWWSCGSLLPAWPPDVICRIGQPASVAAFATRDPEGLRRVDSAAGAVAFLEAAWPDRGFDAGPTLGVMAEIFRIVELMSREYRRRLAVMIGLIREARRILPDIRNTRRLSSRTFEDFFWFDLAFQWAYSRYSDPWARRHERKFRQDKGTVEIGQKDVAALSEVYLEASESLLGFPFPVAFVDLASPLGRLDVPPAPDPVEEVARSADQVSGVMRDSWKATAAGLLLRASRSVDSEDLAAGALAWLGACHRECPPGENGAMGFDLAVRALECWLGHAGGDAAALSRFGRLLRDHSDLMLRRCIRERIHGTRWVPSLEISRFEANSWDVRLNEHAWALARLGTLSDREAGVVLWNDLLVDVRRILLEAPGRLADYFRFLKVVDPGRLILHAENTLGSMDALLALEAFLDGRDSALASVMAWLGSKGIRPGLSRYDLDDIRSIVIGCFSDTRFHAEFLARNNWMWDELIDASLVTRRLFAGRTPGEANDIHLCWGDRQGAFLVAEEWKRQDYPDPRGLSTRLQERCAAIDERSAERGRGVPFFYYRSFAKSYLSGMVRISGGNVDRLILLLDHDLGRSYHWDAPADPFSGWDAIAGHNEVREFLWARLDAGKGMEPVLRWLRRMSLAIKLQKKDRIRELLGRWSEPHVPSGVDLPAFVLPELRAKVARIAAYRAFAGIEEWNSGSLKVVLGRETEVPRELASLRDKKKRQPLTKSQENRLRKLGTYERDPAGLRDWINRDLSRGADRWLSDARFAALESIALTAIREFWAKLIPGFDVEKTREDSKEDWDNALRLYLVTKENKILLKKLLKSVALGDLRWRLRLPLNAAFCDKIRDRGIDVDRWLGEFTRVERVGGEVWMAQAETDPLRVLQMGNFFDTCLAAGGSNAYAAIANAVEVNKRVLYLIDGAGTVIGRKLIGLAAVEGDAGPKAVIVGFYSYGSTDVARKMERSHFRSPWVKISLDMACRDLAKMIGARLESDHRRAKALAQDMALFAKWYNDEPEPFDWWISYPAVTSPVEERRGRKDLEDCVLERIEKGECDPADVRLLLWLRDGALDIMEEAGWAAFSNEEIVMLRTYSLSPAVKELAAGWLKAAAIKPLRSAARGRRT